MSSQDCEKMIKYFEESKETTPISKYQEKFVNRLKGIQSISKTKIEYDICTFDIYSDDVFWCFSNSTLKPCK